MRRLNYDNTDLGFSFALTTFVMVVISLVLQVVGIGSSSLGYWITQAVYTLAIGSSSVVYALVSRTKFIAATKVNKAPKIDHILWGIAAVICLVFAMSVINNLFVTGIGSIDGLEKPSVSIEKNLAGLIICACILPALAEELVFRGTIAQSLYYYKSKWGALAISGALFALFHANPAQTLHQFVLGAFLTLLVFRSGSVWTSVLVHFFNNIFVVILSYTPLGADELWDVTKNPQVAVPAMLLGILGFVACTLVYLRTTDSAWNNNPNSQNTDDETEVQEQTILADQRLSSAPLWVGIIVCVALWVSQLLR